MLIYAQKKPTTLNTLKLYEDVFTSINQYDDSIVKTHLEKHHELDDFIPAHNSYFIITNTTTQTYPFVGKGFHANLGLDSERMKTEGIAYWQQFIHPQDRIIWLSMMNDLMAFTLTNVLPENRKQLTYSWNFRIKTIWGHFKTVFAHTLPIVLDDLGKPVVGITQHTVIGEGEQTPIIGTIKYLNSDGIYETLLHKNYSRFYLGTIFSKRELEISELLSQNLSSKEIAQQLNISNHTVDTHRRNILKKTGLKNTSFLESFFRGPD